MPTRPLVLIHGYSDTGDSFETWKGKLADRGYRRDDIHICSYRSLTNEVSIKDIAEGFDRALRIQTGLKEGEPFDAVVHSTGMLVLRAWLTSYNKRRDRLKHLIGLAPASFGSPLAHKGRSWLGSLFKGKKKFGPDFMESGDLVLDGLELGSRFTWDLAHQDLIGDKPFYGETRSTPYVFVFCGAEGYGGIRGLISEDGTDGTVRWSGCALNTRKIVVDLTRDPDKPEGENRITISDWSNADIPMIPVEDMNHATIMSDPTEDLVDLVYGALHVNSTSGFRTWHRGVRSAAREGLDQIGKDRWQQFVIRLTDERGDGISDYNVQLYTKTGRGNRSLKEFAMDVHPYSTDRSFRCFHVNLKDLKPKTLKNLWMRIIAASGTELVGYLGYGSHAPGILAETDSRDAEIDLTPLVGTKAETTFFYPFTTTLVEIRLNREPLPFGDRPNKLLTWNDQD